MSCIKPDGLTYTLSYLSTIIKIVKLDLDIEENEYVDTQELPVCVADSWTRNIKIQLL